MPRFFFYSVRNYLIGRHSRAKIGTLLNNDSVNIGGWLAVEDPLLQSSPPFVREAPTRWLTVRLRGAFACVTFPCQKGRFQGAGLNFAQLVTVHAEASEVDDIFPLLPIPASSSCVCLPTLPARFSPLPLAESRVHGVRGESVLFCRFSLSRAGLV